jgi:tetratricopeptide (TPR) repeat protein
VIGVAAMRSLRAKFESGAFDQADGLIEILDEYARFDPYVLWTSTSVRAALANARGELDTALALADEALEVSRSEADAAAVHLSTVAMVLRERGRLGEIVPTLEYVVQNHPGVTGFRPLLGLAYAEEGREAEAAEFLQHEIDTNLDDHPMNPLWMATVSMVALLAIDLESAPAARMLYPVLEPWRGRACTSVVSYNGFVNEILGFLALVLDDLDRSADDFEAAIEQAARVGARVSHTRSRLGLARVRAGRGDLEAAIDLADAVEAVACEIGMTVVAEQARGLSAHWMSETSPAR